MADSDNTPNTWGGYFQKNIAKPLQLIPSIFSPQKNSELFESFRMDAVQFGEYQLKTMEIFIDDDLMDSFKNDWTKYWGARKGKIELYEAGREAVAGRRINSGASSEHSLSSSIQANNEHLEGIIKKLIDFRINVNTKISLALVNDADQIESMKLNNQDIVLNQTLTKLRDQLIKLKNKTNQISEVTGRPLALSPKKAESALKKQERIMQKLNLLEKKYKALEFEANQITDPNINVDAQIKQIDANKDYLQKSFEQVNKSQEFMANKVGEYYAELKKNGSTDKELAIFTSYSAQIMNRLKDIKQKEEELNKEYATLDGLKARSQALNNNPAEKDQHDFLQDEIKNQITKILSLQKKSFDNHAALVKSHVQLEFDMRTASELKSNAFPSILRAISVTKFLNPLNYVRLAKATLNNIATLTMIGAKKLFPNKESTAGKIVFGVFKAPFVLASSILTPISTLDQMPIVKSIGNFLTKNPITAWFSKTSAAVTTSFSKEREPLIKPESSSKRISTQLAPNEAAKLLAERNAANAVGKNSQDPTPAPAQPAPVANADAQKETPIKAQEKEEDEGDAKKPTEAEHMRLE